jgi:hypothetical protein
LDSILPSVSSEHHVGIPVTLEREEVIHSPGQDCMNLASQEHVSEPPHLASSSRSSQIVDLPLLVFPRIALPRFSLSPSGIDKMFEGRSASSEPGNDRNNTEVGNAPDPLPDGLLSIAQNGEFHSTGNFCSKRIWNCLSLTIIFYSLIVKKPHRCLAVGLYRCHQRRDKMFAGQCLRIMSV